MIGNKRLFKETGIIAIMKRTHLLLLGTLLIILSILGILDAAYLTREHYLNIIPPCQSNTLFADCGKVLTSKYSVLFGVPLALLGLIHYTIECIVLSFAFFSKKRWAQILAIILTTVGFFSSLYFVYLMVIVIQALCQYCVVSATISIFLFIIAQIVYPNDRRLLIAGIMGKLYKIFFKPIFFRIDPEKIHTSMVNFGKTVGDIPGSKTLFSFSLRVSDSRLSQTIAGIRFPNPVGLAAGFDYEANLTRVLGSIGFGFQTVGTITNGAYEGNPPPMLGRLPQSKSLMVNKGFKNLGVKNTTKKLTGLSFPIPVGISIGQTNSSDLETQTKSIKDILNAFKIIEASGIKHGYYELNISCPNLRNNISFYPPKNLTELLKETDQLHLSRPLFIKMPIEKSQESTLEMLEVIANHTPAGVIFGNLAKNRKNPVLVPSEVAKFPVGNFSGKPTFDPSNQLISLAYKHYKKRFVIIGCGGIFNAFDAYEKITRGANLVQLITGMIYEGPQLISEINNGLLDLLDRDGFTSISDAIGSNQVRIVI